MPNKHFCQGPHCHEQVTTDRFLKSRGVIRGRYASIPMDHDTTWYQRGKYFCSTGCEYTWLDAHMESEALMEWFILLTIFSLIALRIWRDI